MDFQPVKIASKCPYIVRGTFLESLIYNTHLCKRYADKKHSTES